MELENQAPLPASETVIDASPVTVVVETPETPTEIEAESEVVEAVVDSAVAIAEIEAEAQVEMAGIAATVELARIEAEGETRSEQEEIAWLREQMNSQEQRLATLETSLLSLASPQSTPEPSAEELAAELAEEATILTPPSTSDGTLEIETAVTPSSEGEKPEAEPATASVKVKRRAI